MYMYVLFFPTYMLYIEMFTILPKYKCMKICFMGLHLSECYTNKLGNFKTIFWILIAIAFTAISYTVRTKLNIT